MASLKKAPAYEAYKLVWTVIDWLYPPYCGGCETLGFRWCPDCKAGSTRLGERICIKCGDVIQGDHKICSLCQTSQLDYKALRSWGIFDGPLREALHRLKYRQNVGLGEALSIHLIELLAELEWHVDMIVPVPLSNKRMRERGYNQAGLLARPLAMANRIPFSNKALLRVKDTRSQVGLQREERKSNVKGAFKTDPGRVKGKSILVVDDVTTTGATIQSCASALIGAGAIDVYGLTLARAVMGMDSLVSQSGQY